MDVSMYGYAMFMYVYGGARLWAYECVDVSGCVCGCMWVCVHVYVCACECVYGSRYECGYM